MSDIVELSHEKVAVFTECDSCPSQQHSGPLASRTLSFTAAAAVVGVKPVIAVSAAPDFAE